MRRTWLLITALAVALALSTAAAQASGGRLVAHGSVQQVYATGLTPRAALSLLNRRGRVVATQRADALGGVVFRQITPGAGYRLQTGHTRSAAVTVMTDRSAPPSTKVYNQKLPRGGYGYLRTRDGTRLAIDVRLPGGGRGPVDGPYPTLVEYAGYGYADPAGAEKGISAVATLLGFAVVDVNMRGTGCSGGSFDYFEPLQNLDGYDVIETVARQPWVLHHRVGMLGISYGGISQLFVAATDPPHLTSIAPMSVIDDNATTLYPGGILNTGFALGWAEHRQSRRPARLADDRRGVGVQAHPGGRPHLQGQPGPARRGAERGGPGTGQPLLRAQCRRPPGSDHASCTRSTCPSISPASGPTSRPAATARTWRSTSPARRASGSRSPTASTATRWTRTRSTAGMTSSSSTSPTAPLRCRLRSRRWRRPSTSRRWGSTA